MAKFSNSINNRTVVSDVTCACTYLSICTVQHDLADLDRTETADTVERMARNITVPTLVMWGDHDRVSF